MRLQDKLCILQDWVKEQGLRVIIVFEGRDAAGKGGTIKAITERVEPAYLPSRGAARAVRPRESQMYVQRTYRTFPPPAKSSSSTAAGTTAPGWSA